MALWTPAEITTDLWLDAADAATLTLDGSNAVEQWDDKSGSNRHASQASNINRPVINSSGINSMAAIDFSGSEKFVDVVRGFISSAVSAFVVYKGGDNGGRLLDQRSTGAFGSAKGWYAKAHQGTTADLCGFDDGAGNYRGINASASTAAALQSGTVYSVDALKYYRDAVVVGTLTSGGTAPTDIDNTSYDIRIGGNAGGGTTQDFTGLIAEIILFSSALGDTDRQKIEGYLAWKWGLEANLPTGHPYELAAPTLPAPEGTAIRAYLDMFYGDLLAANRAQMEMIYSLLLDRRAITEMIYSLRLGAHVDMRYGDCPELRSVLNMHYSDCPLLRRALVMSYDDLLMHRHAVDMDYAIPRTLTQAMEMRYSIAEAEVRAYTEMSYDLLVNNPLRQALVMSYLMEGDTMVRQVVPDVTIGGRRVRANHLAPEPEWGFYAIPVEIHLTREADYVQVAIGEDVVVTLEGVVYNLVVDNKRESMGKDTGSITWIVETLSPAVRLSADYADPVVCEDPAGLHGPARLLVGQLAAGFEVTWFIDDFPVLPYTLYPNGDAPLDVIEKILAPRMAFVQSNPDGSLRVECAEPADWETREPDYYITWGRDFVSQETTHIKKPGYNIYHISNAMESEERIWADQRDISGSVAEVLGFQTPWDAALAEQLVLEHSGGIVVADPEYLGVREEIWPPLDEPAEEVAFEAGFAQVQRPIYTTRRYSSPVGGTEAVQVEWLRQHLGSVTHAEDGRLEAEIKYGPTDGYSLAEVRYLTRYHLWRCRNERNERVQYLVRRLDYKVIL